MKERIAVVCGFRTPFCKSGGIMRNMAPDDLGARLVAEILTRATISSDLVDEVIFGNVLQSAQLANIARIIAVKSGLPVKTTGVTINRNCASGLESIAVGADKILLGHLDIAIAGGVESMSHFPIPIKKEFSEFLFRFNKAKGWKQRLGALAKFRPGFLLPVIPEINDPLCGLNMGQTAELLSKEFRITRQEQDQFALMSQQRAANAIKAGYFDREIIPVAISPEYRLVQTKDDGPRENQSMVLLEKLPPSFDRQNGSVTAGNSSQITDGAAAVLLMSESKAKELKLSPLGFIRNYAVSGLQPARMGLGPVFAISKLLKQTKMTMNDFDLIEINEAFAAQVLAVIQAADSISFAKKELGSDQALGTIDIEKLNVNGGAIALGHPLGASGTRLVLTLLHELTRRNKTLGLVGVCIGGGQGQAMIVEVA